jgi:hypothetical protein
MPRMAAYSTLFHGAGRGWGMRRRSGFGSVERLASGRYRARYTVPGTDPQVWVKAPETFARRVDADAWLARQRTALEDRVLRPAVLARRMTLQEYVDAWLRDRRSASGQPLRPSTRRVYEHYLVKLVYPESGEVLLTELTPPLVSGWYRRLVPDRPTLRARTYALLRGVLTTAIEDELIAVNPCRVRGASNARPATQTVVAGPAQVNELAAAMPAPLAAAVQIGAWCQLRNGEVLELRRKDMTAELISVRRGVTWTRLGAHVGPPKTDAGVRTVSIPPHVRPVLAAHLESFVPDDPEALLFPAAPGSTEHMRQTTFAYHFKRAVLQTSLPTTFRFHWLRHTGLTLRGAGMSRAIEFCPEAVVKPARRRSRKVPGDGHGICPVLTITGLGPQLKGLTPWPARAWAWRTLSPLVWQTWAWCRSRRDTGPPCARGPGRPRVVPGQAPVPTLAVGSRPFLLVLRASETTTRPTGDSSARIPQDDAVCLAALCSDAFSHSVSPSTRSSSSDPRYVWPARKPLRSIFTYPIRSNRSAEYRGNVVSLTSAPIRPMRTPPVSGSSWPSAVTASGSPILKSSTVPTFFPSGPTTRIPSRTCCIASMSLSSCRSKQAPAAQLSSTIRVGI